MPLYSSEFLTSTLIQRLNIWGLWEYMDALTGPHTFQVTGPSLVSPVEMNRATPFTPLKLPDPAKDLDKICHRWLKMAQA